MKIYGKSPLDSVVGKVLTMIEGYECMAQDICDNKGCHKCPEKRRTK